MKNLKFLICALSCAVIMTSCSKDEEVNFNSSTEQRNFTTKLGGFDVDAFLGDFYGDTFVYGDSILSSDSISTYLVKEVIVGSDNDARGYVAIDQISKQPIGFIDVDRTNAVMKSVDLQTNVTEVSGDLSQDPIFQGNGYDLLI